MLTGGIIIVRTTVSINLKSLKHEEAGKLLFLWGFMALTDTVEGCSLTHLIIHYSWNYCYESFSSVDKACRNSWCASQNAYNLSVNMLLWIISIISHCLFRIVTIPVIECAADFCLGYLIYYHNSSRKINTRAKSTVFQRLRSWSQDFPCCYSKTQAKFFH